MSVEDQVRKYLDEDDWKYDYDKLGYYWNLYDENLP